MDYMTFTDRDTYLAARAEWRADYKALSQSIREQKRNIAATQKATGGAAPDLQWRCALDRRRANSMMKLRLEMKEQSAAQRLARLEEAAAA